MLLNTGNNYNKNTFNKKVNSKIKIHVNDSKKFQNMWDKQKINYITSSYVYEWKKCKKEY